MKISLDKLVSAENYSPADDAYILYRYGHSTQTFSQYL